MVRSLVVGFGVVTALAVAGIMTPKGQAMLGLSHPAAEQAAPVTIIQDKPAPVPEPVQSIAPATAQPQARPVAPAAQRPPAGQPVPPQGGPGGLAGVANILLNLPQVLDKTFVGPSRHSDSWSEERPSDSKPVRLHKHVDRDKEVNDNQ